MVRGFVGMGSVELRAAFILIDLGFYFIVLEPDHLFFSLTG